MGIDGDHAGREVHGDHHEAVPHLVAPHVLLGEDVGRVGGEHQAEGGGDDGAGHRDEGRLGQALHLEDLDVVVEIDAGGQQEDLVQADGLLLADGADDKVIEGVDADQADEGKDDGKDDVVELVLGAHLDVAGLACVGFVLENASHA